MNRKTAVLTIILGASFNPANAENLNRKFGPSWNCGYISVSLPGLYKDCKPCEDHGLDFDQTSKDGGVCRRKDSLRETPHEEDEEDQAIQLKQEAARDREIREIERRGSQRIPLDSDVTGDGMARLLPNSASTNVARPGVSSAATLEATIQRRSEKLEQQMAEQKRLQEMQWKMPHPPNATKQDEESDRLENLVFEMIDLSKK